MSDVWFGKVFLVVEWGLGFLGRGSGLCKRCKVLGGGSGEGRLEEDGGGREI